MDIFKMQLLLSENEELNAYKKEAEETDPTQWDYEYNQRKYKEKLDFHTKVLKGDIFVLFRNKNTGKFSKDINCYNSSEYNMYEYEKARHYGECVWDIHNDENISDFIPYKFKSSICHYYLPRKLMEDDVPMYLGCTNLYDGGKKQSEEIKKGAKTITWEKLNKMF